MHSIAHKRKQQKISEQRGKLRKARKLMTANLSKFLSSFLVAFFELEMFLLEGFCLGLIELRLLSNKSSHSSNKSSMSSAMVWNSYNIQWTKTINEKYNIQITKTLISTSLALERAGTGETDVTNCHGVAPSNYESSRTKSTISCKTCPESQDTFLFKRFKMTAANVPWVFFFHLPHFCLRKRLFGRTKNGIYNYARSIHRFRSLPWLKRSSAQKDP